MKQKDHFEQPNIRV